MPPTTHAGKDLPPVIQRAIARAMDPSLDLRHAERVALAVLIARAEARDGSKGFWVRRTNFAALVGRVERTISSWLTALEDKGWISREQGRARWGDFTSLTVHLTDEAVAFLGLARDSDLSTTYRKKTSHAVGYQGSKQSFGDTEPAARPAEKGHSQSTGQRSRAAFEAKVPSDCRMLLAVGMSPAAVFAAMGRATAAGQRLADIVAVRGDAIRNARAPLAYLKSLIAANVDYRALNEQRATHQAQAADAQAWSRLLASTQAEYADSIVEGKRPDTRLRIWGGGGHVTLQLRDGKGWREAGAVAGEALLKFWRRLATERPPALKVA